MSKFNVTVCRNENQKDGKPMFITRNIAFAVFLKNGSNKFKRLKAKRAFDSCGSEIFDLLDEKRVYPNCKIILSSGEDYSGYITQKPEPQFLASSQTQNPEKVSENEISEVFVIRKNSIIEPEAIKQLESTSKMFNVMVTVGLPDLHPGKDCPVGAACASKGVFYPHLIGNDIGCGMSFYKTSLKNKKLKLDVWSSYLQGLELPWEGDTRQWLNSRNIGETEFDAKTLGTIGGGNHFAELQRVEEVLDLETFTKLGLDTDRLYLLVHTGSRAFGEAILRNHIDTHGHKGLVEGSPEADFYLKQHDWAKAWAKASRQLVAQRFMSCLTEKKIDEENIQPKENQLDDGTSCIFDIWHNCAVKKEFQIQKENSTETVNLWLHRKGAAPSDEGPVIIPGSRGDFSYLVLPTDDPILKQKSAFSLAHGAGRRLPRNIALKKGEGMKSDLTVTSLGSYVICEKRELLFEEIPEAYKDIENIVGDLVDFGLIKVIAKFRPLITYKTRAKVHGWVDHRKGEEED